MYATPAFRTLTLAAASGKTGAIDGVLITTIRAGRIVREETYWNVPDLLAQVS